MQLTRILREGFIAGLIGGGVVALWFLIVDIIAGRPFFTPAMLGSAVFWGVHDPALVVIEYSRIIGYTMIHVSAFIIVGTIAAVLAAEVEVAPATFYLVVVFFAIFEFGFYVTVAVLAQPLLGALAWWNVAIGNAIAAYGMGYYLWSEALPDARRRHVERIEHAVGERDEGPRERHRKPQRKEVEQLREVAGARQLGHGGEHGPPHDHRGREEHEMLHDVQRVVLERRLVESREVPQRDRCREDHASDERPRGPARHAEYGRRSEQRPHHPRRRAVEQQRREHRGEHQVLHHVRAEQVGVREVVQRPVQREEHHHERELRR